MSIEVEGVKAKINLIYAGHDVVRDVTWVTKNI